MTDVAESDVSPAPLHLELPIGAPMKSVIGAEKLFLKTIVEVGREVTERPGQPVQWLLSHASTSQVIRLRLHAVAGAEEVPQERMADVVSAVVSGFTELQGAAVRPAFFNDAALESVEELSDVAVDLGGGVAVMNGTKGTAVTREAGDHVRNLLGESYGSFGSVEGWLEGVNLHDRRTFFVYDSLTGRRIPCEFGNRIPLPEVTAVLNRRSRVTVYGKISYRSDDEVRSVLADELVEFPPDSDLPTADEVRGLLG